MSRASNQSYGRLFNSLRFSEKSLMILYFFALVPCSVKLLMGINARVGLYFLNPVLDTVLLVLFTILSFSAFVRNLKLWDLLFVLAIVWFLFWSPHIYPQTTFAVFEFGPYFVFCCLPYYLVGASINITRREWMFECIGRWGFAVNFFICMLAVMGLAPKLFGEDNNMELAYGILPSVILVARNWLRYKKSGDLFMTILGAFLILALGSRGALLALVLYLAGDLLFFCNFKQPRLARAAIVLATLVVYLLSGPLLMTMRAITSALGFGTRVYDKLLGGEIVDTDSRDWIYDLVKDNIASDRGHIGYGFFYDRVLMGMDETSYAHNIVYEFILDFGYIGAALLIAIVIIFIVNIRRTRNSSVSSLLFAFFCSCVVCLFFSSSYLRSSSFWLFIGLMISTFRSNPGKILAHQQKRL